MTAVYLAFSGAGNAIEAVRRWDWQAKPLRVLVSFAYLRNWRTIAPYWKNARSFMLDSGAYTAYTLGQQVDHDALLAEVAKPEWDEAVGLDVIGDAAGSRRNAEYALARGVTKAMPVFHIGDPWEHLEWYRANFPKVGLSCRFGEDRKTSIKFYEQCFARAWPHKFHSFGWIDEPMLMRMPFHSADAATWNVQPAVYRVYPFRAGGRWKTVQMPIDFEVGVVAQGLMSQMDRYHGMEQQLADQWRREMAQLEAA